MKKSILLLASIAAFAASQNAGAVTLTASPVALCSGGTAASVDVTAIASSAGFVKSDFKFQCSTNVNLKASDNGTSLSAAASSKKGKSVFKSGTNGGSITTESCTYASALCAAPTDTQTTANLASS